MEGERSQSEGTVYHVTPAEVANRWLVYQENGDFKREYDRKEDAVSIARLKAHLDGFSKVKVHNVDGWIDESTYGEDNAM
jgi:Uncharacterized protein conserved in bacteria (DUF2188)